jgi:hypothetical protein
MSRKPQSNAVLKTLPEERQAEIFSRLTTKTAAWPDTSLEAVRKWLADDGLKTSTTALSHFHSWYSLSQQLERNGATVAQLLIDLKTAKPDMTPEQLDVAGQMFFTALSIEQQDSLGWQRAQNVKIRLEQQRFDREKFQFDAAKAALAKLPELNAIKRNNSLSADDKLQQARLKLFGETPK